MLAARLHETGVAVIENTLLLAAARRLVRPADAPPLGTIRSLAYFRPVIEEVLGLHAGPDYFQYLRHKLERRQFTARACGADDETATRPPAAWTKPGSRSRFSTGSLLPSAEASSRAALSSGIEVSRQPRHQIPTFIGRSY